MADVPSGEFRDTDQRALEIWLDLHRQAPPGRKLEMVLEMSAMLIRLAEAGVRIQFPDANEREIFLRTAARLFDRDTMIRAYGWDPDSDDRPWKRV